LITNGEDNGFNTSVALYFNIDCEEEINAEAAYHAATTDSHRPDQWVIDTGAARHICSDQSLFIEQHQMPVFISIAGLGGAIKTNIKGTIKVNCIHDGGYSTVLTLRDVLYVKESPANLISEQALEAKGAYFDIVACEAKIKSTGRTFITADRFNDFYFGRIEGSQLGAAKQTDQEASKSITSNHAEGIENTDTVKAPNKDKDSDRDEGKDKDGVIEDNQPQAAAMPDAWDAQMPDAQEVTQILDTRVDITPQKIQAPEQQVQNTRVQTPHWLEEIEIQALNMTRTWAEEIRTPEIQDISEQQTQDTGEQQAQDASDIGARDSDQDSIEKATEEIQTAEEIQTSKEDWLEVMQKEIIQQPRDVKIIPGFTKVIDVGGSGVFNRAFNGAFNESGDFDGVFDIHSSDSRDTGG
jgi:hypothetical protein